MPGGEALHMRCTVEAVSEQATSANVDAEMETGVQQFQDESQTWRSSERKSSVHESTSGEDVNKMNKNLVNESKKRVSQGLN